MAKSFFLKLSTAWALLAVMLLSSCGADHDDTEAYDPWAARWETVSAEEAYGELCTGPEVGQWEQLVRQDLRLVKRLLTDIIRKQVSDEENRHYLISKMSSLEKFSIYFRRYSDKENKASYHVGMISRAGHRIVLTENIMRDFPRPTRVYILAHEVGHLLDLSSYMGVAGLFIYRIEPEESDDAEEIKDYPISPEQNFAPKTLDNYPFFHVLKKVHEQLLTYQVDSADSPKYVFGDNADDVRGKWTGLDYVDENKREEINKIIEGYKDYFLQKRQWSITDNIIEENDRLDYRNPTLPLLLYFNGQIGAGVKENNIGNAVHGDGDYGPNSAENSKLRAMMTRYDEVMADHFAKLVMEKIVTLAEDPRVKLAWASGPVLFYGQWLFPQSLTGDVLTKDDAFFNYPLDEHLPMYIRFDLYCLDRPGYGMHNTVQALKRFPISKLGDGKYPAELINPPGLNFIDRYVVR